MSTEIAEPAFLPSLDAHDLRSALDTFQRERARLFGIAHRVTGDAVGAEDVVQEAWMRWQRADRSGVKNPAAFLTTVTTNLAINSIQSARHRRETPSDETAQRVVSPLEEPLSIVERENDVVAVMSTLLVRLTGPELAAYVLRKGFDYPYCDVAAVLSTSVCNARQLVRRAQLRINGERVVPAHPACRTLLATSFSAGCRGEMTILEAALLTHARGRCGEGPGCRPHGHSTASTAA